MDMNLNRSQRRSQSRQHRSADNSPSPRKKQLPAISSSHYKDQTLPRLSYQSAISWIRRHQETFTQMEKLLKLYPELAENECMQNCWELMSFVLSDERFKSKVHKRDKQQIPVISITFEDELQSVNVPDKTKQNVGRFSVAGLSFDGPHSVEWNEFLINLATLAPLQILRHDDVKGNGRSYEFSNTESLIFILSDFSLNDSFSLDVLESVVQAEVPVIYMRETDFVLPDSASPCLCDEILSFQHKSPRERNGQISPLILPILSPFPKSQVCWTLNDSEKHDKNVQDDDLYEMLVQGYKEAIVFDGTNAEFCSSIILSKSAEKTNVTLGTISCTSSGYFTLPDNSSSMRSRSSISQALTDVSRPATTSVSELLQRETSASPVRQFSSERQMSPQYKRRIFSNSASNQRTPYKDQVRRMSEPKDFENKMATDQQECKKEENVFVVFPIHHNGASSGTPKFVKWPPPAPEKNQSDLDNLSIFSDISVGFEEIDLGMTIKDVNLMSDEDFAFPSI